MAPRPLTAKENAFIDNLMGRMSLKEKIGQLWLVTHGGAILTGSSANSNVEDLIREGVVGGVFGLFDRENNRQKILEVQNVFINESPSGIPGIIAFDIIHGYLHNKDHAFPTGPIPLGYNFHVDRLERLARDCAEQAAADGYNLTFSPVGDFRSNYKDGRISEGHGTSLHLIGRAVARMVFGYQGKDPAALDSIGGNGKHVDGYGNGIDYTGRDVSPATRLRHFRPFAAMLKAGIISLMRSFNTNAGVPAHGDADIYKLVTETYGANVAFIADYDGNIQLTNHKLGDIKVVAATSQIAGVAMAMVDQTPLALQDALKAGLISEDIINRNCADILRMKVRLGLFDIDALNNVPEGQRVRIAAAEMRGESEERYQAVRAKVPQYTQDIRNDAAAACVLIKNQNDVLPLKRGTKIALLGALAGDGIDKRNLPGTWAIGADRDATVSIVEGLKNVMGSGTEIIYARGANIEDDRRIVERLNCHGETVTIDPRSSQILRAEALEACRHVDTIVIAVGEACEHSGESATRGSIKIPKSQRRLIKAVCKEFGGKKPIVIVAIGGRPLALGKEFTRADALVYTGHGGTQMGNGLADVLSGDTQFSGRLNFDLPVDNGPFLPFDTLPSGRPAPNGGVFWVDFKYEKDDNPDLVLQKGTVIKVPRFKLDFEEGISPSVIRNRLLSVSTVGLNGAERKVDFNEEGITVLQGKYGTLTIQPNQEYSYEITVDNPAGNELETFNFETLHPVEFRKFTVANRVDGSVRPLAPFGYGLALGAKFSYSPVTANKAVLQGDGDTLEVRCKVKNTGTRAAFDYPQLYVEDVEDRARSLPVKEHRGFIEGGLWLEPGEEKEVSFKVTTDMLTFFRARSLVDFEEIWNEGKFRVSIGPNSAELRTVEVDWKKDPAPAIVPELMLS